jgi:non-reducing end alpha-L-arabinofuranosidase
MWNKKLIMVSALSISLLFMGTLTPASASCPCDIYAAGGTPCVAAHSTVRALYSTYNGPLYQVRRTSDNKTQDIGVLSPGGFANSALQDSFLNGKAGTVSKIFDQSPKGNHLVVTPPGGTFMPQGAKESIVNALAKIKVNGYTVYGVYMNPGDGYRNNKTTGVATGNDSEGMYMVCDGNHYSYNCCFDYGNAQTNMHDNGNATMECIYWGSLDKWGHGSGKGPWFMNDCENGLQAGVDPNGTMGVWAGNTSITANYVTGTLKSKTSNFWEIRGGDATDKLKTMYSGRQYPGYFPKKLEGSIVLGTGGDNSNGSGGTFFEGAMTIGCPSDTVEDSVAANIVAAGYGRTTTSIRYGVRNVATESPFKVKSNPSSRDAIISYTLPNAGYVSVNIVDQRGRHIATIVSGVIPAGRYEAVWDTRRIPAGVYVSRVAVDGMEEWAGKIIVGK